MVTPRTVYGNEMVAAGAAFNGIGEFNVGVFVHICFHKIQRND